MPASFANRHISLRVYPDYINIVAEGNLVAQHKRVIIRDHNIKGHTICDWQHYLMVAQRKPGALRNGAPFDTLPESFKYLQSILLARPSGDQEMVDIFSLVLHHHEDDVTNAIEKTIESGHMSKEHVINCLKRIVIPEPPAPITSVHQLEVEPTTIKTLRHG